MADDLTHSPASAHLARNLVSLRHTRALTQDGLARAAAVPHSYQNDDALAPARGVSVVVFAKAGV